MDPEIGGDKIKIFRQGSIFTNLWVVVPHSKSGIVPRLSLLRRWAVGFGEFGKGGVVG